ncbi:hypothetical protein [Longispora albida]|uniref:hypothetical protein n=1 Tax=Longispora albida TaxID=203523 RepID=UPI000378C760|nr:hypothetical protein [Longispora albida]
MNLPAYEPDQPSSQPTEQEVLEGRIQDLRPFEPLKIGITDTHRRGGKHRIVGVTLLDDLSGSHFDYWMTTGEIYYLAHDGTGWTASGGPWVVPGHSYYLHYGERLLQALPTLHGDELLHPASSYQLHADISGNWQFWQVRPLVETSAPPESIRQALTALSARDIPEPDVEDTGQQPRHAG